MPKVDYHIHPGYSIDAAPVSIEDYCRQCINLGLREICFTPHLEVDPQRKNIDWFVRYDGATHHMENLYWLERYLADIESARQKFTPDLVIKAGIEVGFEPGREQHIEHILSSFPFDFVLGSIHCLDHVAISSKRECAGYFKHKQPGQVAADYFRLLKLAVQSRLFDCIAHIDLYRRYGRLYLGNAVEQLHNGYIEEILRLMAGYQMALEINTSGLRRGLDDLHPSRPILCAAIQNGVQLFTIGSDAHSPGEAGQGLASAGRLLQEFSCTVTTFSRRRPDNPAGVDKPGNLP